MADRDDRLAALAVSLSDGTPVDWDAAESSAATDSERRQIRDLRSVGRIAESHAATASGDAAPEVWGPLRVRERIGRGRFGNVYRAWDPRLDREVALKLLRRLPSDDPGDDVIDEGRLLARLRHPNIVTVYGAERIDGRTGVWMELVRGRTLEEELVARGPFAPAGAAAIGADICHALDAVHQAGLVHRDVKAQNVMRDEQGRTVLMDFGTGRALDVAAQPELAGTPLYLAPEVLGGAPATAQSDVYSAGVLVYHLITNGFPVAGRTLGEIRRAHSLADGAEIGGGLEQIPEGLREIVAHALAPDPGARFTSAEEFARALDAWRTATPAGSSAVRRQDNRGRGRMGLFLTAVAAIAMIIWLAFRPTSTADSTLRSRSICDDCGMMGPPSVGADGRLMAFIHPDRGDIAIRDLSTGTVEFLLVKTAPWEAQPQAAVLPALSPDGKLVAFMWVDENAGKVELRLASTVAGSPVRVLISDERFSAIPVAWSPDGHSVLAAIYWMDQRGDLAWVSIKDNSIKTIAALEPGQNQPTAAVSPDGRWVAFASVPQQRAGQAPPAHRPILIYPSTGGEPQTLATPTGVNSHPVWTPDGSRVVFKSDASGTTDLWSTAVVDGQSVGPPVLDFRGLGAGVPIGVARSGRYFFFESIAGVPEISVADLRPGRPKDMMTTRILGATPAWSPDGRSIALVRHRPGAGNSRSIVVHTLDTGVERVYSREGLGGTLPLWFPDGKGVLVLVHGQGGEPAFWHRLDIESGKFVKLTRNRGDPEFETHWGIRALGPDARTLFFAAYAKRTDGVRRLDRIVGVDLPTGRHWDVATLPGTDRTLPQGAQHLAIAAGPSGRELAVLAVDPAANLAHLAIVDVDGRSYREVTPPFPAPGSVSEKLVWTRDGRFLLFAANGEGGRGKTRIMRVAASGGEAEFTGLEGNWISTFDADRDGMRIAFAGIVTRRERSAVWSLDLPRVGEDGR